MKKSAKSAAQSVINPFQPSFSALFGDRFRIRGRRAHIPSLQELGDKSEFCINRLKTHFKYSNTKNKIKIKHKVDDKTMAYRTAVPISDRSFLAVRSFSIKLLRG